MKRSILVFCLSLSLLLPHPVHAYFTSYTQLLHNSIEISDWTPPNTTLKYGSRIITETITNGTFADGVTGWETHGDVSFAGDTAIIGQTSTSMLSDNSLTQTFASTSKNLRFEYQVSTLETLPGFDDPCFMVMLGDQQILQVDCTDIESTTGWQSFSIELEEFDADQLTLSFSAGNTGDAIGQSWAEIRHVTTNVIIGNTSQRFTVKADEERFSSFLKDCEDNVLQIRTDFSLHDTTPCELSFWSVDTDGNTESSNTVLAEIATSDAQQYTSMHVSYEPTGEYLLTIPNMPTGLYAFEVLVNNVNTVYQRVGTQFFVSPNTDTEDAPTFLVRAFDQDHNTVIYTEE